MKKLLAVFLMITTIFMLCSSAGAHPSSVESLFDTSTSGGVTYVGTEQIGWLLNENAHRNSTSLTYKLDSSITAYSSTLAGKISQAAGKWGSPFSITQSSTANGTFYLATMNNEIEATAVANNVDSNGHILSWAVYINYYKRETISVGSIAHEFGHIFGLGDLHYTTNSNKLMYFSSDRTVSSPSTIDTKGAKTITGNLTTHTWSYVHISNTAKHKHCCSKCGGIKTQYCTYNSNNVCIYCGATRPASPNAAGMIPMALPPEYDEQQRALIARLS